MLFGSSFGILPLLEGAITRRACESVHRMCRLQIAFVKTALSKPQTLPALAGKRPSCRSLVPLEDKWRTVGWMRHGP